MNKEDVGAYYTTPNSEDVWQLVAYNDEPTAVMKNLRTGEKETGGVGSRILKSFIKLVPEKDFEVIDEQTKIP